MGGTFTPWMLPSSSAAAGVIMSRRNARVKALVTVAAGALLVSAIAGAQSPGPVNGQDVGFVETDLVANVSPLTDSNGIVHTPKPCTAVTNPPPCVDPNLLNPWGLVGSTPVPSPPSPWWVSDNGSHKSTLYADDTVLQTFTISSTVVSIPCPGMPATACGTPTGVVWNPIDHNGKSGYANSRRSVRCAQAGRSIRHTTLSIPRAVTPAGGDCRRAHESVARGPI